MDRRRILVIFGAAWLSALGLTWFLWSRTSPSQKEKNVSIAAVTRDLQAGTKLQRSDIKLVSVPEKDLPKAAILDRAAASGRTASILECSTRAIAIRKSCSGTPIPTRTAAC